MLQPLNILENNFTVQNFFQHFKPVILPINTAQHPVKVKVTKSKTMSVYPPREWFLFDRKAFLFFFVFWATLCFSFNQNYHSHLVVFLFFYGTKRSVLP